MSNFIEISKEDIQKAEKLLLPQGCSFDENEKIPIIQCMDRTIDVIACPGSGKTTTLLAKLTLILDSLPQKDSKGICVMTHTNVAVNEIKDKLGSKSDILFKHPNYFGTIHSFFNKFCASPYYKQLYNSKIAVIDDDVYYRVLRKKFIPWSKLWKKIYHQVKKELDKIDNGLCRDDKIRKQTDIKFNYLKEVELMFNGEFYFTKSGKTIVKDKKSETFKLYYELLHDEMLSKGLLKYNDVYLLSKMYLTTYPAVSNYLSSRFNYVFIDETQDNISLQNSIIDLSFNDNVVIQRFGDENQAIYNSYSDVNGQMEIKGDKYEITKSMRFSQSIANFISPMRITDNRKQLVGVRGKKEIVPHLLIYNNATIKDVIDKYISIIKRYKLSDSKYPFKACGWVGYKEDPEHLTVNSFVPEFLSKKKVEKKHSSLNYIGVLNEALRHKKSVGNVYKSIIDFSVKYLNSISYEVDELRLSSKSLIGIIEDKYEEDFFKLRTNVTPWTRRILNNDVDVYNDIGLFIHTYLEKLIGINSVKRNDFLQLFKTNGIEFHFNESCENRISKNGINVTVDTVHGVKGETHTATLYLESLYQKRTDLQRIFCRTFGKKKGKLDSYERSSLRIGYVGMSRATDLLCIAVGDNTFNDFKEELSVYEERGGIKLIKL